MVKNTNGGNKSKKFARKHLNEPERKIRYKSVKDADEQYACVVKMCGGDICQVICEDGNKRLCVIRKKFRGRGKRDNNLSPDVIVLVGVRSWEVRMDGKLQKSDLLHVYSLTEKDTLINEYKITQEFIELYENYNEYSSNKTLNNTNILTNTMINTKTNMDNSESDTNTNNDNAFDFDNI